jgi:hypothetical protein
MPDHKFQVFTPFGGSYVPEDRERDPPLDRTTGRSRWPMALIAFLLCITTAAAAAVMATGRSRAPVPELWKQNPPILFNKWPDGAGHRELLF